HTRRPRGRQSERRSEDDAMTSSLRPRIGVSNPRPRGLDRATERKVRALADASWRLPPCRGDRRARRVYRSDRRALAQTLSEIRLPHLRSCGLFFMYRSEEVSKRISDMGILLSMSRCIRAMLEVHSTRRPSECR